MADSRFPSCQQKRGDDFLITPSVFSFSFIFLPFSRFLSFRFVIPFCHSVLSFRFVIPEESMPHHQLLRLHFLAILQRHEIRPIRIINRRYLYIADGGTPQ